MVTEQERDAVQEFVGRVCRADLEPEKALECHQAALDEAEKQRRDAEKYYGYLRAVCDEFQKVGRGVWPSDAGSYAAEYAKELLELRAAAESKPAPTDPQGTCDALVDLRKRVGRDLRPSYQAMHIVDAIEALDRSVDERMDSLSERIDRIASQQRLSYSVATGHDERIAAIETAPALKPPKPDAATEVAAELCYGCQKNPCTGQFPFCRRNAEPATHPAMEDTPEHSGTCGRCGYDTLHGSRAATAATLTCPSCKHVYRTEWTQLAGWSAWKIVEPTDG